jgi:GDSL-like Lipase/Acylhydrolase family
MTDATRSARGASLAADKPTVLGRTRPKGWRDLRLLTRLALVTTALLSVLVSLEVASRLYCWCKMHVSPVATGRLWNVYFPEFDKSGIEQVSSADSEGAYKVLVLGPSVWYPGYSDLGARLEKDLQKELARPVRLYNLAYPGRTSRDALLLYRRLAAYHFDLVVVYHGINDQALNNCAREVYQANYCHRPRFEEIRLLERHPEHPWLVFPYILECLGSSLVRSLVPCHLVDDVNLGTELKTPPSFRANLEEILSIARRRGERVLLLSFAYYIPANYTEAAFQAKSLDYDSHKSPVNWWGTTESVALAVDAHNAVVEDLARCHSEALFTDMRRLMPDGKLYYDDCCHLSAGGCARFAELLMKDTNWPRLAASADSGTCVHP